MRLARLEPETNPAADKLGAGVCKIVAVVIVGPLLAQLDATIVNVSLSNLAQELHTTLSTIQWSPAPICRPRPWCCPRAAAWSIAPGRAPSIYSASRCSPPARRCARWPGRRPR
ncbi:hypothetical protein [Massilia sp. 9096]|uniref:hypothetical protein n=1 Tax=Massilia sp. 9096 TaxID=1500894 RepID=UPI000B0B37AC